ncbi:3-oxoacyl-[acyl-carrier-protein] synthase 2 [bioreactor metagenome]|uniref:3-oxoacyl-[acyl-carrier-protein] synthase 2 n=1 Tax=bioreactor metagenome TaxID=1076179 RepID=A0A645A1X4_9ZZZZ|nr:beta-ketoacyl-[acyl-carrier-protein] synthase family protein [Candidatus Metalachnospira sp.]
MKKRIVITGMGAVTPIGIGVEQYWNSLIEGQCGIEKITRIDTENIPVKTAAEVKNFNSKDYFSARLADDLDIFMQFAYVAAEEAMEDSGLKADMRTGIVMGTALAGLTLIGETQEDLTKNNTHVSPRFVSKILGNTAAAHFSINHGIKGPSLTVSTACSSGGDAITTASMLLNTGAADSVVVMGGESVVSPLFIHSLYKAGAISKRGESHPFSKNRDGFVIGEGGGSIILETLEHALARNADIKGELLACANNTDAYHSVTPHPEGAGAYACMKTAIESANLNPCDIGYLNAHGTSTEKGDAAETKAINRIFKDYQVPVSSTKGATGHMMGAGGITEVITCIKAISSGILPPNINYTEKDEACILNLIENEMIHKNIDIAMSNSFGFGGQNSCIIVGRYLK